jgi:hypothetical protein
MTVELQNGENTVEASALQGETRMSDKVVWIYHADIAAASSKLISPGISARAPVENAQ